MKATASSPFSTSQRPHDAQTPPINFPIFRAKSTFAKLRSLYIKREPQQEKAPGSAGRHPKSDLEVQAQHQESATNPFPPKSGPTPHRPEEQTRLLIRKTIPKEPDRPIVRRLVDTVKTTKSSHSKTYETCSSSMKLEMLGLADQKREDKQPIYREHEARYLQHNTEELQHCDKKKQPHDRGSASKNEDVPQQRQEVRGQERKSWRQQRNSQREELQRHLEKRKHQEEKRHSQVVIRKVLTAPVSGSDTEAGRVGFALENLIESARVSGKILARLTEQLRLVVGSKKSLSRWKQRTGTQSQTPNRSRSIIRTVRSRNKNANQGKLQGAVKVRRYNSERRVRILKYKSVRLRVRRPKVGEKKKRLEEEVESWLSGCVRD